MIQEHTEIITQLSIVVYMAIGMYVSMKKLDDYAFGKSGLYPIAATFLTIIWPLVALYILFRHIEKKIYS